MRRDLPGILFLLLIWITIPVFGALPDLTLFQHGYPRFYQFRYSEGLAATGRLTFEEWDKMYVPFDGIEGKVMNEEVPGRSAVLPYFTRFKKEHPEKLVLIHINGRGRDPRDNIEAYFAGHWQYYNGCKVLNSLSVREAESELSIENPNLFRVNMGLNGNSNEDLAICGLTIGGKPDWNRVEQVQLLAIDKTRKTIRVKRGCYGTVALAFQAGKTYVAAHVTEGPWGPKSNLLWAYNFSPDCPRDMQGRTCADIRMTELARLFNSGGPMAGFDGLEFDVLMGTIGEPGQLRGARGIDTDGDGRFDNGWADGINRYGIGVYRFLQGLRTQLGENKLIMADGMSDKHQRSFDQLNGIESEGWPVLTDIGISDWSGGLNRHFFWNQNARPPVFNYINHKFRGKGENDKPEIPWNIHRLVLGAAQLTDSIFTYSDGPAAFSQKSVPVWDELVKGTENQSAWLGMPLGAPVRLARKSADLLNGQGRNIHPDYLARWSGADLRFTNQENQLLIMPREGTRTDRLRFRFQGVPTNGPDLSVFLTVRSEPMPGYPVAYGRIMRVKIAGDDDSKALMTWSNSKPFAASFYFRDVKTKTVDLEFEVEGGQRVWLANLTAHAAPDAVVREFEKGLVLVNPALHDYPFDLAKLFPGKNWRRIQGSANQDAVTNNGRDAEKRVILKERDGLFLIRN